MSLLIFTVYETLIACEGLFHLQKNYKNAIACFEKAFSLRQPDALNAYKAAGVYGWPKISAIGKDG